MQVSEVTDTMLSCFKTLADVIVNKLKGTAAEGRLRKCRTFANKTIRETRMRTTVNQEEQKRTRLHWTVVNNIRKIRL